MGLYGDNGKENGNYYCVFWYSLGQEGLLGALKELGLAAIGNAEEVARVLSKSQWGLRGLGVREGYRSLGFGGLGFGRLGF